MKRNESIKIVTHNGEIFFDSYTIRKIRALPDTEELKRALTRTEDFINDYGYHTINNFLSDIQRTIREYHKLYRCNNH